MENTVLRKSDKIPIDVIKVCVSDVTNISVELMEQPNRTPFARKKETAAARNISMALSKDFSGLSLAKIGMSHGGRDHATVLHAHDTVQDLLDTKDIIITDWFNSSKDKIFEWYKTHKEKNTVSLSVKEKTDLIKYWIKNHVPLFVRQQILILMIHDKCVICKHELNTIYKNGNRIKTLPGSMQRIYKKQLR
jgi:hypothetical protein